MSGFVSLATKPDITGRFGYRRKSGVVAGIVMTNGICLAGLVVGIAAVGGGCFLSRRSSPPGDCAAFPAGAGCGIGLDGEDADCLAVSVPDEDAAADLRARTSRDISRQVRSSV